MMRQSQTRPMAAFLDHWRELRLQRGQAGNAAIDFGQMIVGGAVDLMAGRLRLRCHVQKLADVIDLEAKLA